MNMNLTTNLGGPFTGKSSKQTIDNYNDSQNTLTRRVLRDGWNTAYANNTYNSKKRVTTPFRAVNNSGDYLGRVYYSCGGPNPTNPDKPGMRGSIGAIWSNCDNTGVPASSCNTRYVADSSLYTRFRREQSQNRNYNDAKH